MLPSFALYRNVYLTVEINWFGYFSKFRLKNLDKPHKYYYLKYYHKYHYLNK